MVSGAGDYQQSPFNLATQGHRQPGSSFKPFTLADALQGRDHARLRVRLAPAQDPLREEKRQSVAGNERRRRSTSRPQLRQRVRGTITLTEATAISDNSVFSQLGTDTQRRDRSSRQVRAADGHPLAGLDQPAMILGGLKIGVSSLDMAHAYETFATGGNEGLRPEARRQRRAARSGSTRSPTASNAITAPSATVGTDRRRVR